MPRRPELRRGRAVDAVGDEDLGAGVAQSGDAAGRRLGAATTEHRRVVEGRAAAASRAAAGPGESKTTRSGCRAPSTSRAVSSGSSASTVPMPTAIASDSARQRWTSSRLSSPEIQGESPGGGRGAAVEGHRQLQGDQRQAGAGVLAEGLVEEPGRGRLLAGGEGDLDAAVAEDPGAAAGGLLGGVVGGDHDPRDPGLEDRVDARRLAALVRAGLERHVHRRPGGVARPARRQSASAARSACSPPSSAWKPSPRTSPSRTTTAPTSGFGLTRPRPPSASSSARRRWARSVPVSWLFMAVD